MGAGFSAGGGVGSRCFFRKHLWQRYSAGELLTGGGEGTGGGVGSRAGLSNFGSAWVWKTSSEPARAMSGRCRWSPFCCEASCSRSPVFDAPSRCQSAISLGRSVESAIPFCEGREPSRSGIPSQALPDAPGAMKRMFCCLGCSDGLSVIGAPVMSAVLAVLLRSVGRSRSISANSPSVIDNLR